MKNKDFGFGEKYAVMQADEWGVRGLRWLTAALFWGRAYQHFFFEVPVYEWLWDESLMRPLVEGVLRWNWGAYIADASVNAGIEGMNAGFGILYAVAGAASIWARAEQRMGCRLVAWSALGLFGLSLAYWKEKFWYAGELLEYSLQWATPLFWYGAVARGWYWVGAMRWAIAGTFLGHGLYAMGIYPMPQPFLEMTMGILRILEGDARLLLRFVGMLDAAAAIGIFLPRTQKVVLWYCMVWGTLTACARVVANVYESVAWWMTLHEWGQSVAYRLVHGGIPWVAWWAAVFRCRYRGQRVGSRCREC